LSVFERVARQSKSSKQNHKPSNNKNNATSKNRFNNLSNNQVSNFYFVNNKSQNSIQNEDNQFQQKPFHSAIKFNFANTQTKLKVSQPGDICEQEADRIADRIMKISGNSESYLPIKGLGKTRIDRKCKSCIEEDENKNKNITKKLNVQTKLRLGEPGDIYEQEADRVAEQVMRIFVNSEVNTTNQEKINRKCSSCKEEEKEDQEKMKISRKEATTTTINSSNKFDTSDSASIEINNTLTQSGSPIDSSTKEFMESRFGYDFSNVRIHADERAARSAQSINALAYTIGSDVVFDNGKYNPSTAEGRYLLAHELTHTVQQSNREVSGTLNVSTIVNHAESIVQPMGDITKIPKDKKKFDCDIPTDSPSSITDSVMFGNDIFILSTQQKRQIENFVMYWHENGSDKEVRVDGFASLPASDEHNWILACKRARAVEVELKHPSSGHMPGIPSGFISVFAHGETDEFGSETDNRRVTLFSPVRSPPPPITLPYDEMYGPSTSHCLFYQSPLANMWLTYSYRNNAECACSNTPDEPHNNCNMVLGIAK
jgi:outer membrane protein OmpA-like peptidoglycan-associated protein